MNSEIKMKFQYCLLVSVVLLIFVVAGVVAVGYENQNQISASHRISDEIKVQKFPLPPVQPLISDNLKLFSTKQPTNVVKNKIIETLFKDMKDRAKSDSEDEETTASYVCRDC